MRWRNCGLGLLIWSIAATASAQATCSFDELKQAIKDNDKAFVKACSSKSDRPSPEWKMSSPDSKFTPEEYELVWGKKAVLSGASKTSASKRSASSNPFLRGLKKSGHSLSDIKKVARRQENMGMTDSAYYLRREIAAVEGRDNPLTEGERERLLNRAMRERDSFESGSKKSVKAAEKWSSKTDRALCMDWMTAPALNLQQGSRKREIDRRGIDCWEYGNVREERRNSEQRFLDALSNIGRSGSNRAPSRQRSQSSSGSVNAPYLTNTQPVIGGVMCSYSDGSVVRRNGYNNCPRRMGGE